MALGGYPGYPRPSDPPALFIPSRFAEGGEVARKGELDELRRECRAAEGNRPKLLTLLITIHGLGTRNVDQHQIWIFCAQTRLFPILLASNSQPSGICL